MELNSRGEVLSLTDPKLLTWACKALPKGSINQPEFAVRCLNLNCPMQCLLLVLALVTVGPVLIV